MTIDRYLLEICMGKVTFELVYLGNEGVSISQTTISPTEEDEIKTIHIPRHILEKFMDMIQ